VLKPLEVDEELVGEFGGQHVRGPVEHRERDEEGLVPQLGPGVAEPVPALLLHSGLPEVREPRGCPGAAVVPGEHRGELGRLGGPVSAPGEEVPHGPEGEQPRRVVRAFGRQMRPYDVLRVRRLPDERRDPREEWRFLDGDDEVAVRFPQLVGGSVQMGVAQRTVTGQRQVPQHMPARPRELRGQRARRRLVRQRVDRGHAQAVQQHPRGGVASAAVRAGQDEDAFLAQPREGGGEGGALGEDLGQRVLLLLRDLP
jgi:hypothetical protein